MAGTAGRDGARVDRIARVLAARETISRREVVGGGAKLAAGVAVSSPLWALADAAVAKVHRCPHGQHHCKGKCVSFKHDRRNCGHCGHACGANHVCLHGQCRLSCAAGLTACSGKCVNFASDPANCGACGKACPGHQVCSHGHCMTTCASGETVCGAACVTLATDAANCGSCGHACTTGQACTGGQCVTTCGAGQTLCGAACVTLATDAANCGSCGHTCPGGQTCVGGQCHAPAPTCTDGIQNEGETDVDCGGATTCPRCAVGKKCLQASDCAQPAAGGCTQVVCMGGTCTSKPLTAEAPCTAGGHVCDGSGNCVGCLVAGDCPLPPSCFTATCMANTCGTTPVVCADCHTCVLGSCVPAGVGQPCATGGGNVCDSLGNCVQCIVSNDCPSPPVCHVATCMGNTCGAPQLPNGTSCAAGKYCFAGICTNCKAPNSPCAQPYECCNGMCLNTNVCN